MTEKAWLKMRDIPNVGPWPRPEPKCCHQGSDGSHPGVWWEPVSLHKGHKPGWTVIGDIRECRNFRRQLEELDTEWYSIWDCEIHYKNVDRCIYCNKIIPAYIEDEGKH